MKANEFRKVILFMANRWSRQTAIEIFGKDMGEHFWIKWLGGWSDELNNYRGPDYATMRLFYAMSDDYLQKLLDYIKVNYNG